MFIAKRNSLSAIGVSLLLALPGVNLHAQDLGNGWGPNALEIAALPDYCQNFFLKRVMPPNCDGVHHLCAGKVLINRCLDVKIPKGERRRIAGHAKKEVDYIFSRNNPQCLMMDEARATQSQIRTLEILLR